MTYTYHLNFFENQACLCDYSETGSDKQDIESVIYESFAEQSLGEMVDSLDTYASEITWYFDGAKIIGSSLEQGTQQLHALVQQFCEVFFDRVEQNLLTHAKLSLLVYQKSTISQPNRCVLTIDIFK